jgi:hypothetical protein
MKPLKPNDVLDQGLARHCKGLDSAQRRGLAMLFLKWAGQLLLSASIVERKELKEGVGRLLREAGDPNILRLKFKRHKPRQ